MMDQLDHNIFASAVSYCQYLCWSDSNIIICDWRFWKWKGYRHKREIVKSNNKIEISCSLSHCLTPCWLYSNGLINPVVWTRPPGFVCGCVSMYLWIFMCVINRMRLDWLFDIANVAIIKAISLRDTEGERERELWQRRGRVTERAGCNKGGM